MTGQLSFSSIQIAFANHCISKKYKGYIDHKIKVDWCYANVGERRNMHPIFEYDIGWINDKPGDWAVELHLDQWWFARKEDKMLFTLTFSDQ